MCWELCRAIKKGDLEQAREFVDSGYSVHDDYDGWTPLQFAHDNVEITQLLLDRGAYLCSTGDKKTALHLASEDGFVEVVRLHLDRGANVDMYGRYGSPLYYASRRGRLKAARLLLDRGANVNLIRIHSGGPLHVACSEGGLAMVKLLVDRGADVNAKNEDWETPLYLMCDSYSGNVEIARLLLERGAKIEDHFMVHSLCCGTDRLDMLELLLEHGANPDARDNDRGWTPLILACENGQLATVRFLLDRGVSVDGNDEGEDITRPLHTAIRNGRTIIARLLIERGADVNAAESDGETPLYEALFIQDYVDDRFDFFQLLLDRGAAVDSVTNGETPLHIASRLPEDEMIKMLLDGGADVNAPDSHGDTPLLAALHNYNFEVQLLLDRGAAVNATTKEKNETALHIVSRCGEAGTVKMLLDRGANIHAQDDNGDTSLHGACEMRHLEVVQLLLARGAAVNIANGTGKIPLHLACCEVYDELEGVNHKGHLKISRLLLDGGSNVNAMDENGKAPLHMVCEMDHDYYDHKYYQDYSVDSDQRVYCDDDPVWIVRLLLDRGADVEAKTKDGLIPMHLACQKDHLKFVWIFARQYPWLVLSQSWPVCNDERKNKRQQRSS